MSVRACIVVAGHGVGGVLKSSSNVSNSAKLYMFKIIQR